MEHTISTFISIPSVEGLSDVGIMPSEGLTPHSVFSASVLSSTCRIAERTSTGEEAPSNGGGGAKTKGETDLDIADTENDIGERGGEKEGRGEDGAR